MQASLEFKDAGDRSLAKARIIETRGDEWSLAAVACTLILWFDDGTPI